MAVQKSNQGWDLEDPDQKFLYADKEAFEQGFLSVLDGANENDVIVAQVEDLQTALHVYFDMAAFWFDPGVINGKEVCKGKNGMAFAGCVKGYVDQGKRVTVWKDGNGNYYASIP